MTLTTTEVECIQWIHENNSEVTTLGRFALWRAGAKFKIKLLAAFCDKCFQLGIGDRSLSE